MFLLIGVYLNISASGARKASKTDGLVTPQGPSGASTFYGIFLQVQETNNPIVFSEIILLVLE